MKVIIELEKTELNDEILRCLKTMSEILKKEKTIEKKQEQEKPKDEPKKEEKVETKEEQKQEEKVETKEENVKHKYTFEEVKSAAIKLKKARDKEGVKQVFELFGVKKLQEIKEEDYENFIKAVEEVL